MKVNSARQGKKMMRHSRVLSTVISLSVKYWWCWRVWRPLVPPREDTGEKEAAGVDMAGTSSDISEIYKYNSTPGFDRGAGEALHHVEQAVGGAGGGVLVALGDGARDAGMQLGRLGHVGRLLVV